MKKLLITLLLLISIPAFADNSGYGLSIKNSSNHTIQLPSFRSLPHSSVPVYVQHSYFRLYCQFHGMLDECKIPLVIEGLGNGYLKIEVGHFLKIIEAFAPKGKFELIAENTLQFTY